MAWESRAGQRYYYRKVRRAGCVVSEYGGTGEAAALMARGDALDRRIAAAARAQQRSARDDEEAHDARLDALEQEIRALVVGALLAAGCHTHKGTWRRGRR